MAKPKLTTEQREVLISYLAAEYSGGLIRKLFAEKTRALEWEADEQYKLQVEGARKHGLPIPPLPQPEVWPQLTDPTLSYYRKSLAASIEKQRKERRESSLNTGLALKEERVARLKEHADDLYAIRWVPSRSGKLHNEKAWRETLDDIAKETGGRKLKIEHSGAVTLLDLMKAAVDAEEAEAE